MSSNRTRLESALIAYALLGGLAAFTLEGGFRLFVLLLLGVFAFKSWLAVKKEKQE